MFYNVLENIDQNNKKNLKGGAVVRVRVGMIFRNSSFKIWLVVLAFASFSATTVMVQPSQTAEVRSPAVSSNFHDFDKSIKNLQNFLDSVDSSDARAIKLAAAGDNSEKQPSDSGCDDALSEKSDSELLEKKDCPPGNDPDRSPTLQ